MLQLKEIRKSYKTADFTQTALDGVSLAFRDNEFAAVLGPSGSGKTTMLNIIGGLDHYDSGDLVIDEISTKKYKDRDWDTYRNNRIGFVFQSYNLIPHQTILSNVELALTLSGVSVAERRARAKDALIQVGLGDHIRKRPNQLSGGQMQRVAIARALINDPEILLADEPTGALDTQTSSQVMDLLTHIAKDRLVIMVTHNPELAEEYANRIIHLKDGQIVSDSRPFDPATEKGRVGRAPRKASMSFFTAISLSFSNLMTKMGRTFVTALAGSIGIIGIAAILSLANGINAYIENVEEETLSIYPLTIQSAGLDLSSMLGGPSGDGSGGGSREVEEGFVREQRVVETMFSMRNNNDLASLKTYLDGDGDGINSYVNTIQYLYNVTPQVYLPNTGGNIDQINPDGILASIGMGGDGGMGALMGFGGMGMNVFYEMPGEQSMFEHQYDIMAGHWPTNYDELVLVLSSGGRITDFELYSMGLRDRSELRNMIDIFMNNSDATVEIGGDGSQFSYEDLMSASFKLVNPVDRYQYDDTFSVWVDKSTDQAFMQDLLDRSKDLKIVGIVQPKEDVNATSLSSGLNYSPELIAYLMEQAENSQLVKDQMAQSTVNVLTGVPFLQENEEQRNSFDFSRIITVDEEAFRSVFDIDPSAFDIDPSDFEIDASAFNIDPSMFNFDMNLNPEDFDFNLDMSTLDMPQLELGDMSDFTNSLAGMIQIPTDQISAIMGGVLQDFVDDLMARMAAGEFPDPTQIPNQIGDLFNEYLARPEVQANIAAQLSQVMDLTDLQNQVTQELQSYLQSSMEAYMAQVMQVMQTAIQTQIQSLIGQITTQIQTAMADGMAQFQTSMEGAMGEVSGQIQDAMGNVMEQLQEQMGNIDPNALTDAFQINMGEEEILELMTSIMNPVESTYERNLSILGYADPATPSQINIYPRDFDSKQEVLDRLDAYNDRMDAEGTPERVVRYTDLIGAMMSSVTDIIGMVTYALIAFVAISLVVSSIMIGVITYISVLERKKEIGILRAIGASKRNIRQVFNAETLIVGFVAGVLGVLVTLLLTIIANIIVWNQFEIRNIAQLPVEAAFALIAVSMFLTFIAGLLPSSKAARKDPVEALRSE